MQIMHPVAPSKNFIIANHASYTLCKLYNILGMLMAQEQIFKTDIYKMHCHPPKCKFVGWLTIQNRTADRLRTRGWPNNVVCPSIVESKKVSTRLLIANTGMLVQSLKMGNQTNAELRQFATSSPRS
jgi:hypothetical protein